MKKLAATALAAAALLGAGVAQAYEVGTFSNGFVVPNVWHNGMADTTAVGLINKSAAAMAGDTGLRSIYWTFFDQNSMHVTDGCFPMTGRDYEPFVWAAQSGGGMAGKRGYLLFTTAMLGAAPLTAASVCKEAVPIMGLAFDPAYRISANAFQVDTANHDVAFTPVIDGPVGVGGILTSLGPNSLVVALGAALVPPGPPPAAGRPVMHMRYYIDQAPGGNDSFIVVWSTGDQRGTHTVDIYDDKQNRKSVNFPLEYSELDWFNVESIPGIPASFTDGFIEWDVARAVPVDFPGLPGYALADHPPPILGSVYTYTWMIAPAFGAVQTLLGAHHVAP